MAIFQSLDKRLNVLYMPVLIVPNLSGIFRPGYFGNHLLYEVIFANDDTSRLVLEPDIVCRECMPMKNLYVFHQGKLKLGFEMFVSFVF